MKFVASLVAAVAALMAAGATLAADENDQIAFAVFDYIDGWYDADPARMERALHPELAKRIFHLQGGRMHLEQMSAMTLVQATRAGGGAGVPPERRVKEVVILDVTDDIASVKAIMHAWTDYLHMARVDGRWVIVNVLWRMHEQGD